MMMIMMMVVMVDGDNDGSDDGGELSSLGLGFSMLTHADQYWRDKLQPNGA